MATYNRAHFILETLDSIQNQVFNNWECLIIDDGSTDNTFEVLNPYLKAYKRFKFHSRKDNYAKGLPGCRNYGLDLAQGELIVFFDDDDIVHPDNLKLCVKEFQEKNIDFCRYLRDVFIGNFHYNFEGNKEFEISTLNSTHLEMMITGKIQFNSCQVMWKKYCFSNHRFNEKLMYAEEWECYSRILADGAQGISIEKVLFYGRKHPESNTGEFWNNDPIRRNSKAEAVKLVIFNLYQKKLLSPALIKYFIGLGVFLKEKSIINYTLHTIKAGKMMKLKYHLLFDFYPYIVWVHRLKKKIKNPSN